LSRVGDPSGEAAAVTAILEALALDAGGGELELYRRSSRVARRSRGPAGAARSSGKDAGLAVRWRPPGERRFRFAASTGGREADARWCLAQAVRSGGVEDPGEAQQLPAGSFDDRDPADDRPSEAALRDWLGSAWGHLEERVEPIAAWVEVAHTTETWASTAGLAAVRVRRRAWAGARVRGALRPLLVAARGLESLSTSAWSEVWDSRGPGAAGSAHGAPRSGAPVTFAPEAAASVVAAVLRAFGAAAPAGDGWRVTDAPLDPGAVFGATFDDAGFPTRARVLGDGRTAVPAGAAAGTLRRASFRDRPEPRWFRLRVEPGRTVAEPPRGLWVEAVRIHPTGEAWRLEVDGALVGGGGRRGGAVRGAVLRAGPEDLVTRCVAGSGAPLETHLGVRTPALVFERLPLSS